MSSAVSSNHPPIAVVITVILLLFFFFGIFCVYFCRCCLATLMTNWHFRRSPSGAIVTGAGGAPANPNNPANTFGLHPDKIHALPSFKYSDVKDFRRHNYGFECAICLTEFRDDHLLRLLTVCCHVFHQDCIDLWFESHSTCPVCRSDLDVVPDDDDDDQETLISNNRSRRPDFQEGSLYHHMIHINDDDDDDINNHDDHVRERSCSLDKDEKIGMVKLSRSNTTGHSIVSSSSQEQDQRVQVGDEKDKYTLRLRDNVKINIIRRHNYAVSCITFGDFSSSCTNTTTSESNMMMMMNGSGLMGDQLFANSETSTSSIKEADHHHHHHRLDIVVG